MAADERKDKGMRDRLKEIEDGYIERADENRGLILEVTAAHRHFTRLATFILLFLSLITAATAILSIYLLDQNSDRVEEIQTQRAEFVRAACSDQNDRHDRTISRLRGIVDKIEDPRDRLQAEQNIGGTISLIEALAPEQDCDAVVEAATSSKGLPRTMTDTGG